MLVKDYIKRNPQTILAKKLKTKFGENSRKEISITSGTESLRAGSNLSGALKRNSHNAYIVGGRAGKNMNDGYIFATYKK